MKNILAIFAHPDDEVLACGGTLVKRFNNGDKVKIIILSNGCGSRNNSSKEEIKKRIKSCKQASKILGTHSVCIGDFPDNKFDSIALLDIIKYLEKEIKNFSPDEIFTHFCHDLNIDHRVTFQAVKTIFRPISKKKKFVIFECEVPSSTDWIMNPNQIFKPNHYEDIKQFYKKKEKALKCYSQEMRESPHSRSFERVNTLAKFRGMHSGFEMSEAFIISFSRN